MGMRRRQRGPVDALPVVTAQQVVADRAAGLLARAWVLPTTSPMRTAATPATGIPLGVARARSHPSAPVPSASTALLLEIAPGHAVPLPGPAVVGRRVAEAPDRVAVLLDDPGRSVSREHAAIRPEPDGTLVVEDLGSANGTTVVHASGAREDSSPGRPVIARAGDTVVFGDYAVRVLPA